MNKDKPVLSVTELQPTKCIFQQCIDSVDIARRSSARWRKTTVRWQKQVFIHTRLSCAYLALARLSCPGSFHLVNENASVLVVVVVITTKPDSI